MLVGNNLDLASVVQFYQVNRFLDVLQLFLVAHAKLLVASPQVFDPFLLITIVSHFLN